VATPGASAELERALAFVGLRGPRCCPPAATPPPCDSDGEELAACQHCGLPVGDVGYASPECGEGLVHGECLAQLVVEDLRKQDGARLRGDAELKRAKRSEHDIGWKAERIPRNAGAARRLQCLPLAQGMCCLVLEPSSNTVRVAPTFEPAASVNLAYLSLALAVRLREGREPFFSLDPIKATSYIPYPESKMQVKRFAPHWLAGTSVGEVMFQADYHLKELSMGEYDQPVLGMASCRESDEAGDEWSGREWFVVRKAEVQVSDDAVLVPDVIMGVEARAQVVGAFGLEDAKITRPDHPLVKYAEAFTKNFDLIAERKSVIFHLRELAKASVLAKYLAEARVALDDSWFSLADEELRPCVMEIPQLWNEQLSSQISVAGGRISAGEGGSASRLHGVYGGVDFGVDRMQLAQMAPLLPTAPRAEAVLVSRKAPPTAFSMIGGGLPTGRAAMMPTLRAAIAPTVRAQGVDLDLGTIDLSSTARFPGALIGDAKPCAAWAAPGDAFWSALSSDSAPELEEEWRKLLRKVFHPVLSDRRSEGTCFIPPRTCVSYLSGLRDLVRGEEELRRGREEGFLSPDLGADVPFPRSWAKPLEEAARWPGRAQLLPLPLPPRGAREAGDAAGALEQALRPSRLVFDRSAEDGCKFRIYRLGRVEVRTTQAFGGEETIGAVFSARAPAHSPASESERETMALDDRVVKATQYVEHCEPWWGPAPHAAPSAARYYVVLETSRGAFISSELLGDGCVTFDCNPQNLASRNSFARVVHSVECQASNVRVGELKRQVQTRLRSTGTSASQRKRFARELCKSADGHPR